jgi:peptidyl-prolyl cis-trans isomerase B (cyclophilin B)
LLVFSIKATDKKYCSQAPSGASWGCCVFGKVTDGMDTVDAIATVSTGNDSGHADVPVETVIITKATAS